MKRTNDFLVVFDNNCRLCRTLAGFAIRFRIVPAASVAGYDDLSDQLRQRVDADRFKYEMALLGPNNEPTKYGLEGLLTVLAVHLPMLARLNKGSRWFPMLEKLYHILSWNRYVIMPRKSAIKCDCEPPLNVKLRLAFVGICWLIAVAMSALLGLAIAANLDTAWVPAKMAVTFVLVIVGTGWALQMAISRGVMNTTDWLEYLGHLGTMMVVGVLVLLPAIASFMLPTVVWLPLLGINILISSGVLLRMHINRIRAMGRGPWWNVAWFLALQSTAAFWLTNV